MGTKKFLPSLETLNRRSTPELLRTLKKFGLPNPKPRLDALRERIFTRIVLADHPSNRLTAAETVRIQNALTGELRQMAKNFVRAEELKINGLSNRGVADRIAMWISVMDVSTCDDCDELNGEEKTMAEWEDAGLPGSSNLICDGNCRCYLAPGEMFEGDVDVSEAPEGSNIVVTITVTADAEEE